MKRRIKEVLFKILSWWKLRQYQQLTKNAEIPIMEIFSGQAQGINKGPHAGKWSHHQTALLNVLMKLRPEVCLEIGTYHGETAKVFGYYFKKYQPQGVLITADIYRYENLDSPYIRQVLVYPHVIDPEKIHIYINPEGLLPHAQEFCRDSVKSNSDILRRELAFVGKEAFDFCYIDGDHQEISFLRDLEIAKQLIRPGSFMLLDDTQDECHESAGTYRNRIAPKVKHYDFEDWPLFAGLGLIETQNLEKVFEQVTHA